MNLLLANFWLPSAADLQLFGPELVLVGTIVAILVLPLIAGRSRYLPAMLTLVGALIAALATATVANRMMNTGPAGALTPSGTTPMLISDSFTIFFRMFVLILLVLVTWLWLVGMVQRESGLSPRGPAPGLSAERSPGTPEFFVLLLTSAIGMMLMVGTLNLLVLVVAMETASLPSYAIVASDKRSRLGSEAALKYVVFGAASAAVMLYGVSLLYGVFGTLDLGAMAGKAASGEVDAVLRVDGQLAPVFWLGLAALGAGILFKIAAVPMHFWCPDVFEGAPTEITTWLSIASKAAGLGVLLRIVAVFSAMPELSGIAGPVTWAVGILASVTCTVGNLAALRQQSVKRTLAYSSIAHAGYMMMAAAILVAPQSGLDRFGTSIGASAIVAYLFVYLIMNVGAFGATALVAWQTGSDHISAFTALGRRAPMLALPMAICLFSLVGLPPLGGFAAKWFLIVALGKTAVAAQPWLWGLVVVACVNTAISLYYYVRIIRQMYLVEDANLAPVRAPLGGLAIVNACAVALILLGTVWFSPLGRQSDALARDLYGQSAPRTLQATR